jgi:hypothetical protein
MTEIHNARGASLLNFSRLQSKRDCAYCRQSTFHCAAWSNVASGWPQETGQPLHASHEAAWKVNVHTTALESFCRTQSSIGGC